MFKTPLLCLSLCAALEAQPHLPKRSAPTSQRSTTQQRNVEKLKGDLESIKGKSQITPQLKQQFAADSTAMAEGATKPSQATVQEWVNDLTAATADKNLSSREVAQLTSDFNKVLNSAGFPCPKITPLSAMRKGPLRALGPEICENNSDANRS